MLGLTQPKIVFCEKQNIDRVRDAQKQLGNCVPIYTFDKYDPENDIGTLLKETGTENVFR